MIITHMQLTRQILNHFNDGLMAHEIEKIINVPQDVIRIAIITHNKTGSLKYTSIAVRARMKFHDVKCNTEVFK